MYQLSVLYFWVLSTLFPIENVEVSTSAIRELQTWSSSIAELKTWTSLISWGNIFRLPQLGKSKINSATLTILNVAYSFFIAFPHCSYCLLYFTFIYTPVLLFCNCFKYYLKQQCPNIRLPQLGKSIFRLPQLGKSIICFPNSGCTFFETSPQCITVSPFFFFINTTIQHSAPSSGRHWRSVSSRPVSFSASILSVFRVFIPFI